MRCFLARVPGPPCPRLLPHELDHVFLQYRMRPALPVPSLVADVEPPQECPPVDLERRVARGRGRCCNFGTPKHSFELCACCPYQIFWNAISTDTWSFDCMVIARARVLLNPGSREIVSFARTQVLKFSNQCSQEFKDSVARTDQRAQNGATLT